MERYLRVNLLGPGPRLMKKEFTGPRSHKGLRYTALYVPTNYTACVIRSRAVSRKRLAPTNRWICQLVNVPFCSYFLILT